jgi:hypothetical protein
MINKVVLRKIQNNLPGKEEIEDKYDRKIDLIIDVATATKKPDKVENVNPIMDKKKLKNLK